MKGDVPNYVVKKGYGYFQPTPAMKAIGFRSVPCGKDGPEARGIADEWNARWQAARQEQGKRTRSESGEGYVYFLRRGHRIKIGFSKNPFTRTSALATGLSEPVDMLMAIRGTKADEKRLHTRFMAYRQSGEWFVASQPLIRAIMRAVDGLDDTDAEQKVGTSAGGDGLPSGNTRRTNSKSSTM